MEIHQLRYFVEVAHTGRFTRAAERCSVTQPTLSHQIRKLEEELGEPLFERQRSRAVLTAFGEAFYPRAQRVLAELRAMTEEARSFAGTLQGELRIGAIPTIAPYLLPSMIRGFIRKHAKVRVSVTEEVTANLLAQLKSGELDVALVSPPIDGDGWSFLELPPDELLVTMPADHALARAKRIRLAEVSNHPLVLMKEAHCLSNQALQVCEQAGTRPTVSIRSSQLDTVQALVEAGLGISFTPAMALPYLKGRKVCHRSIGPSPIFRKIALVWRTQTVPSRIVQAFVKAAGERKPSPSGL